MENSTSKPLMDPSLQAILDTLSFPAVTRLTREVNDMMRKATSTPPTFLDDQEKRGISHKEVKVTSEDSNNYEIILSILQPVTWASNPRPCIFWIHGGGFHWGDRLHTIQFATDIVLECDAICVSVEYRLAPEYPFSVAVEDCYTALKWTGQHIAELGIDPKRLMVGGISAGGGLAAATLLLCRDRQGPEVCAQCLICPALDDRLDTISSRQYVDDSDFMPRSIMEDVWRSSLKKNRQGGHLAPGRTDNLSGLPTTFLDVGSAEVLRDETVAFASKLWASGVQAELHVWAGGFHGSDMFLPEAALSQASNKTKMAWVKRIFGTEKY